MDLGCSAKDEEEVLDSTLPVTDLSGLDDVKSRRRGPDDLKHKRKRGYEDAVRTQLPISKERDEA